MNVVRLLAGIPQPLRQAMGAHAVDDAEVDRLGHAAHARRDILLLGTPKIWAATGAWMSWSSANACRNVSSPQKWASSRSSTCE